MPVDNPYSLEHVVHRMIPVGLGLVVIFLLFLKLQLSTLKRMRSEKGEELTANRILKTISEIKKGGGFLSLVRLDECSLFKNDRPQKDFHYRPPRDRGVESDSKEKELWLYYMPKYEGKKGREILLNFVKTHNLEHEIEGGFMKAETITVIFPKDLEKASRLVLALTKEMFGPDVSNYKCYPAY